MSATQMAGALALELEGEQLVLLPQKAAFWPRERMLVIADIHFGKAAAFRSLGIPVPKGTTTENLQALDELVELTGARHVLFLGDFLHARAAHAASTQAAMLAWRRRRCELVLGIGLVDEPYTVGPFSFCHHPDIDAPGYVLAGHVHPVYVLATRFDALRLPCFIAGPHRMILPSFGAFTGGHAMRLAPDERVWVSSGEAVHSVR